MNMKKTGQELLTRLQKEELSAESLIAELGREEAAERVAMALLAVPAESELPADVERLLDLLDGLFSNELLTVVAGLLWREDVLWLSRKDSTGKEGRLLLLRYVAGASPASLSPLFWRAVGERGVAYLEVAFAAIKNTHPVQAAPLLVKLCQATVEKRHEMDIRATVDHFLDAGDSSVRSAFLDAMRMVHQVSRRKIMTHLDISLMAELDKGAIEHRGKSFFYDDDAEKKKRDEKSKDVFGEIARRLERGDTRD